MKKSNKHTLEKISTGTKVLPSDESDAESVPEDVRRVVEPPVELSRLEPTLGSLSWFLKSLVLVSGSTTSTMVDVLSVFSQAPVVPTATRTEAAAAGQNMA